MFAGVSSFGWEAVGGFNFLRVRWADVEKIMLDNNITSNHLYSKSTERYSMVDQKKIEDTLDGWRKRLTKLPDYIIDSKLF